MRQRIAAPAQTVLPPVTASPRSQVRNSTDDGITARNTRSGRVPARTGAMQGPVAIITVFAVTVTWPTDVLMGK